MTRPLSGSSGVFLRRGDRLLPPFSGTPRPFATETFQAVLKSFPLFFSGVAQKSLCRGFGSGKIASSVLIVLGELDARPAVALRPKPFPEFDGFSARALPLEK